MKPALAAAFLSLATGGNAELLYDAGGGGDNAWSTAANWSPDAAFTPGGTVPDPVLRFDAGSGNISVVDAPYLGIEELRFDEGVTGSPNHRVFHTHDGRLGFVASGGLIESNAGSRVLLGVEVVADGPLRARSTDNLVFFSEPVTVGGDFVVDASTGALLVDERLEVAGGLIKRGDGTLRLRKGNRIDGGVTLESGTIQVVDDAALGSGPVLIRGGTLAAFGTAVNLDNDVELAGDLGLGGNEPLRIRGDVTGTGDLRKLGSQIVVLSGDNSFTGTVNAGGQGFLIVDGGAAIPDASEVTVGSGGTFTLYAGETIGGLSGEGAVNVNRQAFTVSTAPGGFFVSQGTVRTGSGGGSIVHRGGGTQAFRGVVSGGAGVEQHGAGVLTLSGANTHTGGTTLGGGVLAVGNDAALGTGPLRVTGGTLAATGGDRSIGNDVELAGTLTLGGGDALVLSGELSGVGGLRVEGPAGVELWGDNGFGGGVLIDGGLLAVFGGSALPDTAPVGFAGGGSLTVGEAETVGGLAGVAPGSGVRLDAASLGLDVAAGLEYFWDGGVTAGPGGGPREILKAGAGRQALGGTIEPAIDLRLNAGELRLEDATAGGNARLDGGRLTGFGAIGGDLLADGGDVDLSGDGRFETLRVGGDFTVAAGDTLWVDLGAASASDLVEVAGDATLEAGSTLRAVAAGPLTGGDAFAVLTAGGTLSDASTLHATGVDGVLRRSATGGTLRLTFEAATAPAPAPGPDPDPEPDTEPGPGPGPVPEREPVEPVGVYAAAARSSPNPGVGVALDTVTDAGLLAVIGPTTTSNVSRFAGAVDAGGRVAVLAQDAVAAQRRAATSVQTGVSAARRAGVPAAFGAGPGLLFASAASEPDRLHRAIVARELDLWGPGPAEAEAIDAAAADPLALAALEDADRRVPRGGAFAQAFGVRQDVEALGGRPGSDTRSTGFEAGFDRPVGDDLFLGLSFGHTRTRGNVDGGLARLEGDAFRAGPYASWSSGPWHADAAAGVSLHRQGFRRDDPTGRSTGDADALGFDGFLDGGRRFAVGRGVVLTPTLGARYGWSEREAYRESGPAGLAYDELARQTLHGRVGLELAARIDAGRVTLVPEVALGWEHEFLGDDDALTARFASGSAPFRIDTAGAERDTLYAAAGLSVLLNRHASAWVRGQGNFGERTETVGVAAGFSLSF